jgi:class 3 adenylate cyclase
MRLRARRRTTAAGVATSVSRSPHRTATSVASRRAALDFWIGVAFAAGATLLVLALDAATRWPTVLSLALHDYEARVLRALRPASIDSVVVVGIDQATIDAIALPFALWHREIGTALEALATVRPRVIAVDVVLPDRSFDPVKPGLDRALLRGIVSARESGAIVLALQPDASGRLHPIHAPFVAAAGPDGVGAAVYPVAEDGVVRRYDSAASTFVTGIGRKLGVQASDGLIDYTRGDAFGYVPLVEVLRWHADGATQELERRFANKAVVLGSVLPLVDRRRQPVSLAAWEPTGAEPPGVLIHAQAVRSMLARGFIADAGPLVPAALALLIALAGASRRVRARWAMLAGALAIAFVATTWLLDRGWFVALGPGVLAGLLAAASRSGYDGWHYLAERNRVARTFAGYVSPQVFDAVLDGRLVVRGHARLAFLVADVRGFTALTESAAPDDVLEWLNAYYAAVTPILHAHGATIDSFRGDGVTALFGAPQRVHDAPVRALRAARAMLRAVRALNDSERPSAPRVEVGIGLAYGDAVFGDLGSRDRRDFTAIADEFNLAARLQDLTKALACPILLSDALRTALRSDEQERLVDFGVQTIRGHSPIRVWGSTE